MGSRARAPEAPRRSVRRRPFRAAFRSAKAAILTSHEGSKMPTRKKIGLIGAGNIGGELARLCASAQLGDVYLFDVPARESFAKGKALDLEQNSAITGCDAAIKGTSSWADLDGADVLI